MRDLINRGAMVGPRMFVAGYGLYIADAPPRPGYTHPSGGRADNVDEVMRVVREHIAAGVDVIKMFASTGSLLVSLNTTPRRCADEAPEDRTDV
jgi:imidazolonepropionase-like amidohydrolase